MLEATVVKLRALGRLWSAVLAAAVIAACASPTLPLPPPAAPTIEPSAKAGMVHLKSIGGAEADAIIVIVNRNTSVPLDQRVGGAEADGNGSWDADIVASHGDYLDITQESGTMRSPPETVQVP